MISWESKVPPPKLPPPRKYGSNKAFGGGTLDSHDDRLKGGKLSLSSGNSRATGKFEAN